MIDDLPRPSPDMAQAALWLKNVRCSNEARG